jgi:hypothetical protein
MGVTEMMALQMADLGLATRDEVYAPDADASGKDLFTSPAAQAAVAAAATKHRNKALASGDSSAVKWNSEHIPSLHALTSHN